MLSGYGESSPVGEEVQQPCGSSVSICDPVTRDTISTVPTASTRKNSHRLEQAARNTALWDETWDLGHHTIFATSAENSALSADMLRRKA